MSAPEPPKKRRGCFFYGCLTSLALALLLAVAGLFIGWKIVSYANAKIMEYTDTTPVALPKVEMPVDELAKLKERVAAFGKALDAHTNTPPLTLSSREINALLENSPQVKEMKLNDRFYVSLEGDQITGQISLPLDQYDRLPLIKTKGRYLNGVATLAAALTNSQLSVVIQSMEVKGKPLPAQFIAQLQQFEQQTIVDDVNNNPTNRAALDRFESIQVRDGTLIIKAKPQTAERNN